MKESRRKIPQFEYQAAYIANLYCRRSKVSLKLSGATKKAFYQLFATSIIWFFILKKPAA